LDRDELCLAAARKNAEHFLTPAEASSMDVRYGDILQPDTIRGIKGDVVYAWGSLHHTGEMWQAIQNTAGLCPSGGQLVLAIYNRTPLSPFWLKAKRLYAAAPSPIATLMAAALFGARATVRLAKGQHPFRTDRGMSVWYDAIDWLGGLPYECATADELTSFLQRLGFTEIRASLTRRSGCNEFAFQKQP
jgi:2-polyprenyl-6-hydroxyphenyl methylase/3-demethylubiquinone-9 3-methyltransferase